MKSTILRLFLLVFAVNFVACSGDEPQYDEQCYYVRYTAIAQPDRQIDMHFANEDGDYTLIQSSRHDGKFEYCVGPVAKGFVANLVVSYSDGGAVSFLSIEVARGPEPFVLKKKGTDYFSLEYVVE